MDGQGGLSLTARRTIVHCKADCRSLPGGSTINSRQTQGGLAVARSSLRRRQRLSESQRIEWRILFRSVSLLLHPSLPPPPTTPALLLRHTPPVPPSTTGGEGGRCLTDSLSTEWWVIVTACVPRPWPSGEAFSKAADKGIKPRCPQPRHTIGLNSCTGLAECFVCWLVGCLTSQQQASVSQGRICSDNFTCCHT